MSGLITRRKLHENTAGDAELADEVLGIFLEQVDGTFCRLSDGLCDLYSEFE